MFNDIDRRVSVVASPVYQKECEPLFDLFCASRKASGSAKLLVEIQAGLGESLIKWQEVKRKAESRNNKMAAATADRLILVLKHIADSIAWRELGYDRVQIQLIAEHHETGFIDHTFFSDLEQAKVLVKRDGDRVLVNDLTTILRHGDLTVIGPNNGIKNILENKSSRGAIKSGRAK